MPERLIGAVSKTVMARKGHRGFESLPLRHKNMSRIEAILRSEIKPKEKQTMLACALAAEEIPVAEFMAFFESAKGADKGTCADVMKHVSAQKPSLLAPYMDTLIAYINFDLPRVKWGVPEAIGNMAKDHPDQAAKAIPNLLKNTADDKVNTTVIKWCAAYALSEIARHDPKTRKELLPVFESIIRQEKNSGVKNVYLKALKAIEKEK